MRAAWRRPQRPDCRDDHRRHHDGDCRRLPDRGMDLGLPGQV